MRALGVTLVTLAVVLGAGGVARRPLADTAPDPTKAAPPEAAAPPAADADGAICKGPAPRVVEIDMSKIQRPDAFVSLNSRGYNYRQPGEPPQLIPDSTGSVKPDAPVQP